MTYRSMFYPSKRVVVMSVALASLLLVSSRISATEVYERATFASSTVAESSDYIASSPIQTVEAQDTAFQEGPEPEVTDVEVEKVKSTEAEDITSQNVFTVPFYSQFADITSPSWKKVGCGIASLAMLIEFYEPGTVNVDTLLEEGIEAGAYLSSAGWTYAGLIDISRQYGLDGEVHDLGAQGVEEAFSDFKKALKRGPAMASVHYTFDPKNPIPHLVIVNGVEDGMVFYNDPADKKGNGSVSVEQFQKAWKKRYIEFYPAS